MSGQMSLGARVDQITSTSFDINVETEDQDDTAPHTQDSILLNRRPLPIVRSYPVRGQGESETSHLKDSNVVTEIEEHQTAMKCSQSKQAAGATTGTGLSRETSNESMDAQDHTFGPNLTVGSSRSPVSRGLGVSSVSRNSPTQFLQYPSCEDSAPTRRSRKRGLSLRRALLARKMQGKASSSGSVVELLPMDGHTIRTTASHPSRAQDDSIKKHSKISVLPVPDDIDLTSSAQPSKKLYPGTSPLPHYEAWLKRKRAHGGFVSGMKTLGMNIHKAILRIQDTPPSRDGRHIPLCRKWKDELVDERTGRVYIDNTIRTSRYTLWNFLPRQLFAQFSKLANFYFLCVAILQMIPGLSTTGTYTTIIPLCIFVCISMAKEGYDDLRRYRLDKAENSQAVCVLDFNGTSSANTYDKIPATANEAGHEQWVYKRWSNVRVADIVKLSRDEAVPADIILIHAEDVNGHAYIETTALDGETNLKSKQASQPIQGACQTLYGIARCDASVVVEDPNIDLYKFEGKVTIAGQTLPLTNAEIMYRGSILRNTTEAVGMVIYTGEECKIRMNANKNPRIKAPSLQALVNKVVVILVFFVLALSIFNTAAYQVWSETTEEKAWYLTNAGVSFFPILTSFIIMFNTLIPLSLYVSLEIIKLFQMILMDDIEMYDELSDTPMEARTSTINEELGQVSYIFSDKTGTLTNNSMRFRKMSVAGSTWLHDTDLQREGAEADMKRRMLKRTSSKGKRPMKHGSNAFPASQTLDMNISGEESMKCTALGQKSSVHPLWRSAAGHRRVGPDLNTTALLQYVSSRPQSLFATKVRFFLLSLSLCHTCLPELQEDGTVDYQAASPDELALVRAAKELGYMVIDKNNAKITIKSNADGEQSQAIYDTYQILDIIEFSSKRKRMTAIVRMPDDRICAFTKGADSTIIGLLRLSNLAMAKSLEVERRANDRKSIEAVEAIRRNSEQGNQRFSFSRTSMNMHRASLAGLGRPSLTGSNLQPIRDEVDGWLEERELGSDIFPKDVENTYSSRRSSTKTSARDPPTYSGNTSSPKDEYRGQLLDETLLVDDGAVFERCFQDINDFATEGLRTLLYGYRYVEEEEYQLWKKAFTEASISLVDRQEKIEKVGRLIEKDLELGGATAVEDKLQEGVPETIDKLRRANIKMWMLTGDKRETAINIGHSCRLIKKYSTVTIIDQELGEIGQRMAAVMVDISRGTVAHSVVVIDGHTLATIETQEAIHHLFIDLAVLVDSVICCRASPSQKASLVHALRKKVKKAVTLAIGDGANDIAMIQEAHVGIGITGKEGLQAARTSDYSIAQFRFLLRLLLVHGRWNYVRTCKYTLGTFWKEMLFYLTQALYQRYAGYTGTSLYEPWSLSMFNTLFTSLPVIFLGIFEKDLYATTLLAIPELYTMGQHNSGFNLRIYVAWMFMASAEAMIVFFTMLGLFGQAIFTQDSGVYAMGAMTFTACVVLIGTKLQFLELHNKSITCLIAMLLSIGGWFLWNILLSTIYQKNAVYDVKAGLLHRFGRNTLWWLALILIVASCWMFETAVKSIGVAWLPSDVDVFRELEKDPAIRARFERAAVIGTQAGTTPGSHDEHLYVTSTTSRTAEEQAKREAEVQKLLDHPRVMLAYPIDKD